MMYLFNASKCVLIVLRTYLVLTSIANGVIYYIVYILYQGLLYFQKHYTHKCNFMRPHNYSLPDADLHETYKCSVVIWAATYTDSYTNRTVNVEIMDFTAPIFTRPQLLSGITWRESIPNFTKIGLEMWKERVEKSFNTLSKVWLSVDF